jgi:hypothetical protein
MKKILIAMFGASLAMGAFAQQGTVILENSLGSGNVTLHVPNGPLAAAGTYQVALLWFNGSSFQQIGAVYQTSTANGDGPGYFNGETVTVPTYSATGTFMVEGWTGNYPNLLAAEAGGATLIGETPTFINHEGTPGPPPVPPVVIRGGTGSGWDGNLVLTSPEPSTLALGCLGGAVLWLFRRRK